MRFPGSRVAFPGKDEMAEYLTAYAERFQLPVEHRVRVERLERAEAFGITAGLRRWRARTVIVATGAHVRPRIPSFALELAPEISQLSALEYRKPEQLPGGPVLVVGAGNSGPEIALDLATRSGDRWGRVYLAGRDVGYVPGAALGNGVYPLLRLLGGWGATGVHRALRGGADPLGRGPAGGPRRRGRRPAAPGGGGSRRDAAARRRPRRRGARRRVVHGPATRPRLDRHARPRRCRSPGPPARVGAQPGLYFLGLPFQSTITSHLVGGVGRDARSVVDRLARAGRATCRSGAGAGSW